MHECATGKRSLPVLRVGLRGSGVAANKGVPLASEVCQYLWRTTQFRTQGPSFNRDGWRRHKAEGLVDLNGSMPFEGSVVSHEISEFLRPGFLPARERLCRW